MKKFVLVGISICFFLLISAKMLIGEKTNTAKESDIIETETSAFVTTAIEEQNFVVDEEEDGSYTFHLPITITKPETRESITKVTTVNSKDFPAKVLIEVDGDKFELHINLEDNTLIVDVGPYEGKEELPMLQAEKM